MTFEDKKFDFYLRRVIFSDCLSWTIDDHSPEEFIVWINVNLNV